MLSEQTICSAQSLPTYATFPTQQDLEHGLPSTEPQPVADTHHPVLLLLASTFFYTLMQVFAREVVTIYNTSLIFLTFYSGVACAVMSQIALVVLRQPIFSSTTPVVVLLVFARSFFGAISMILGYAAFQLLPIGVVTCLYSLNTIMTSLLGWAFLKERLSRLNCLVLFIVTTGAISVGLAQPTSLSQHTNIYHLQGVVYSLLMGLSVSIVFVIMRGLGQKAHYIGTELTTSVCCAALAVAWFYFEHRIDAVKYFLGTMKALKFQAHLAILFISFCHFAGAVLFNYGMRSVRAEKGAVLMTSSIPMSFLLGLLFLGEFPTSPLEIAGCLLITVGAYASAVEGK